MPNIALEIRLDLSSIEEYQVLYVQNCLWKMNSRRYEAPSSKTVVITVAAANMNSGCLFYAIWQGV